MALAFTIEPLTASKLILSILLLLTFSPQPSFSDPRSTEAALICTNQTAPLPQRQTFVANFLAALDSISPQISNQGYGSSVNGTTVSTAANLSVYTYGECMKDLSRTDCNLCFAQIKTSIQRCQPFQNLTRGGRLFFDGCYLRYDEYLFYGDVLDAEDKTVCGTSNYGGNQTVFKDNAHELMKNLTLVALNNSGFADGMLSRRNVSVYGLVQCWEVLNTTSCNACLNDAVAKIMSCSPKDEGRVLNAGCYLRYSTQKFYNNTDTPLNGSQGGSNLAVILATSLSCLAFLVLATAAVLFGRARWIRRNREKKQLGALLATVNNSKLNFSYETLEEATNYFHDSNKLGQGGSGSVYRAKLADGRVVAVKRLFFNTRQWVDHFFNEINLISSIDHKNLVKLLGCSITGPESLLVYEFVPNKSLHDYLFGKDLQTPLSWDQRYRIIMGTAEGLAYLHEESSLKIIHRDIKLSNILLEHDFTPKIADFGLVRLLPEDKSHLTTAIAGTLGYMAPEYVVRGMLTEKADVYSFGVLLIEVSCGKKNNTISDDSVCMLHMVWNMYIKGRLEEAIDEALRGTIMEQEASRFLQIGLLCVQANAELRPAMSMVVKMLSGSCEVSEPTQPPYLNSTSTADVTRQDITDSLLQHSRSASSTDSITDSWINPR